MNSVEAADLLIQGLVARGVRQFVLSPGSRSAPLAYALAAAEARGEIELYVRLDERGAGFFALGLAKAAIAHGRCQPVAVVCTSGTAVANLHPAVLEADLARVPLILLTADRPADLRGVLASQTIDQLNIFGSAVRGFQDLNLEQSPIPAGRWAVELSTNPNKPGPVHLNLQYREPLHPGGVVDVAPSDVQPATDRDENRTVVIAGDGAGVIARQVAEAQGWPLLAEPTSGALGSPNQITAYRYLLPVLMHNDRTKPLRAIVFGRPTLNRSIIKFLSDPNVEVTVIVNGDKPWPDAWHNTKRFLSDIPDEWLRAGDENSSPFLGDWLGASKIAEKVMNKLLDNELNSIFGPLILANTIAEQFGTLIVGASNPIRDLDLVSGVLEMRPEVIISNRGVAGIDGTIATALGVASATSSGITRLYLGDLTFLHDVSSLLSGYGEQRPQLQIIVANDGGGTIFSTLEHGDWAETSLAVEPVETPAHRQQGLTRVFTTPQFADLAALCRGYQVPHQRVTRLSELQAALSSPNRQVEVVEVILNGQGRRQMQRELREQISNAILNR